VAEKKRTVLVLMGLLRGLFRWSFIAASIATFYLLYRATAGDGPWLYVLWSAVATFAVATIAFVLSDNIRRLDYMYQLLARGYPRSEADLAWRMADGGGFNVLLGLQQAETRQHCDQAVLTSASNATDRSGKP